MYIVRDGKEIRLTCKELWQAFHENIRENLLPAVCQDWCESRNIDLDNEWWIIHHPNIVDNLCGLVYDRMTDCDDFDLTDDNLYEYFDDAYEDYFYDYEEKYRL
jgi:hypothetical protein